MSDEPKSLVEDLQKIPVELKRFSQQLPDKLLFCLFFVGWVALFHFLGNSTQGYVKETSLFGWMHFVFTTSEGDELGLYMPAIVLALAYWKREQLMAVSKARWWPGFVLVLAGLGIHVVGYVVQQSRISIIGFFVGLYGITGMVWGWRWLLVSFFPFCLFAFCVPLATETERITLPLRLYATQITSFTCRTISGRYTLLVPIAFPFTSREGILTTLSPGCPIRWLLRRRSMKSPVPPRATQTETSIRTKRLSTTAVLTLKRARRSMAQAQYTKAASQPQRPKSCKAQM